MAKQKEPKITQDEIDRAMKKYKGPITKINSVANPTGDSKTRRHFIDPVGQGGLSTKELNRLNPKKGKQKRPRKHRK